LRSRLQNLKGTLTAGRPSQTISHNSGSERGRSRISHSLTFNPVNRLSRDSDESRQWRINRFRKYRSWKAQTD
jgi:hypothetical protein